MTTKRDTIFALATPAGKSALATIRISGPKAIDVIKKISSNMPSKSNVATLNNIIKKNKEQIDKTITTIFKSPKSYTGEDMAEVSTHGGPAIISRIVEMLTKNNLRIAEPGEFTRRAFENNKLDLTQVEAISDIINSETEAQRKQAINQLNGLFSDKINQWSDKILKTLADIEAVIDFSDEDLPKNVLNNSKEQIENIYSEIDNSLSDNRVGEKIRNGFVVAILGKPNVGKSSFINNIAKRNVAIVTEIPGTTRDAIEIFADIKGLPVRIIDTAGIRKTSNKLENIGVKKTYTISDTADINLIFIKDKKCFNDFAKFNNKIFVQSIIDINEKLKTKNKIFYISSKNSEGIEGLLGGVYNKIINKSHIGDISVSRERHRLILVKTMEYLKSALEPKNIDIFAEDVRLSLNEISKIVGKKDIDDVLDIIFSDFCIGK